MLKSIISAVFLAILVAVLSYIVTLTDIAQISLHQIANIAVLTGAASLLSSLLTTKQGTIAGTNIAIK